MTSGAEDMQAEVLRAYTVLCSVRPSWPGGLILNVGLGPGGSAISLAANVAGAVCLTLEPDPALLRNALRAGSCDFVVNTLDEALRAMKNEIRKRRPLSVGLEGNPETLLQEMVERGVAPELFTGAAAHPDAAGYFRSFGALLVGFRDSAPVGGDLRAADILEAFVAGHAYELRTFGFATSAELRAFDLLALSQVAAEDGFRRQWLLSAGRIFPRERRRVIWLTDEEGHSFQAGS